MKLPEVGQIFENFKILQDLGSGGIGHVLLAEDIKHSRKVAMKFLGLGHDKLNSTMLSRFEREARVLASLNHPNIVKIYAIGKYAGCCFLVMEYVEGANLASVMEATEIDDEKAISIVQQVLRGLYEAHQKGLLHRDIKPENILIDNDGKVKIVDFGLCRDMSKESERITKDHLTLETISYWAPEVIQFENPSPSADIFSLGVVLFEMLVGRHPFHGSAATVRMYRLCHDPIKLPKQLYHKVPVGLPDIVEKMTSLVLDYRYADTLDVLADLEKLSGAVNPSHDNGNLKSEALSASGDDSEGLLQGGYDMDEALRIIEMTQNTEDEDDSTEMEIQVARIMSGAETTREGEGDLGPSLRSGRQGSARRQGNLGRQGGGDLDFGPLTKNSLAQAKEEYEKNKKHKKLVMPEFYEKPKNRRWLETQEWVAQHPRLILTLLGVGLGLYLLNQFDLEKMANSQKSLVQMVKQGQGRSTAAISTKDPYANGNVLKIERLRLEKRTGKTVFKATDELEIVSTSGNIVFSKLKDGQNKIDSLVQFTRNPFLPPLRQMAKGKFDVKTVIVGSAKDILPLQVGKTFDVLFTSTDKGQDIQSSRVCEVKETLEFMGKEVFNVSCTTRTGSREEQSIMYYSADLNLILKEVRTLNENGVVYTETQQIINL